MLYLKEHRQKKGITLPKLAQAAGMSKRTVESIQVRGDCLVSNAQKLAKVLGITLDELCEPPK